MRLADFFVSISQWAEQLAGPLVGRQQNNLKKARALENIEDRLARMEADGVIDPQEGAEMVRLLREQGMSTNEIEALMTKLGNGDSKAVGKTPTNAFSDAVRNKLDDTRIVLDDERVDTQIALNKLVFEYNHNREMASQLNAAGHKADMAVIQNLKA